MRRSRAVNPFLWTWALFSVVLLGAILGTDKLALHRTLHPFHSLGLDRAMSGLTYLADGWVPTSLALLLLLFRDVRSFLMVGLSCGFSALIVQVLKRLFDEDRPHMFKARLGDLHWVDGVELHHHLSFPSGHATAAFSMCFALAVLIDRRAAGWIMACFAALLAYTRVYLSQHFAEDILAGAALGTMTAVVVGWWLYSSSFASRKWLRKGPLVHLNQ